MGIGPTTWRELKEVDSNVIRLQVDHLTDLISEVLPSGGVIYRVQDHTELLAETHRNKEGKLVLDNIDY